MTDPTPPDAAPPDAAPPAPSGPVTADAPDTAPVRLTPGTPVTFVDRRGRLRHDLLHPGAVSDFRGDIVRHDDVLGQPDGVRVRSSQGRYLHVFVATLRDHVLRMKRHAQIVYPKDIAMLLTWADVYPGATVVEGGFGSGALTLGLLRAVGHAGRVITYELRQEAVNRAAKNVAAFLGDTPNHRVRVANLYDGIVERDVDRVVLDVPEPWDAVPAAVEALRPGGIFASYIPTAIQLQRLGAALDRSRAFAVVEALETILRPWHVTARSVRPEQKIIGHTGFLMFARRTAGQPVPRYLPEDAPADTAAGAPAGASSAETPER